MKNATGILIEIALNLYVPLDGMNILTILILPIHVHKYIFIYFLSFSFNDQLILDKGSKVINGERIVSSTNIQLSLFKNVKEWSWTLISYDIEKLIQNGLTI